MMYDPFPIQAYLQMRTGRMDLSVEIVGDTNIVSIPKKSVRGVRSDEAGTADDKDFIHFFRRFLGLFTLNFP